MNPYLEHIEPTDQLKDLNHAYKSIYKHVKNPLPVYEVVDIQGDAPNQHFKVECEVAGIYLSWWAKGLSRRFCWTGSGGRNF